MKKSVRFLALVEHQNKLFAVLQVRGRHNVEKELREESWSGGCQVTVHGKAEPDETLEQTLLREAAEEVGIAAAGHIRHAVEKGHIKLVYEHHEPEKVVLTYAAILPYEFLQAIRWHASSGGLRLVAEQHISYIRDLTTYDKRIWIDCLVTVVFPDEIEAVRKAFEIFA